MRRSGRTLQAGITILLAVARNAVQGLTHLIAYTTPAAPFAPSLSQAGLQVHRHITILAFHRMF